MESNDRETTDNDAEEECEEEIYDEEESTNNGRKNKGFECVEKSDSDESQKLDPDYLCSEDSGFRYLYTIRHINCILPSF